MSGAYGKSYSLGYLASWKPVKHSSSRCQKAYYLSNCSSDTPIQFVHAPNPKQSVPSANNPCKSHLQIFRNRLTRRVSLPHNPFTSPNQPLSPDPDNIKANVSSHSATFQDQHPALSAFEGSGASKVGKELKTVHLFFFSGKHKGSEVSPKRGQENYREHSKEFDDEQFRKQKCIIMTRKLHRKKERLAQRRQQRYEQQFHNKKEIPIHHTTQLHFSRSSKAHIEGSLPQPAALSRQRTNQAIQEILKLQQGLKNEQRKNSNAAQYLCLANTRAIANQICVRQIEAPRESRGERIRIYTSQVRNGTFSKSIGNGGKGQEEGQLGPWKRNLSADFEGFI